MSDEKSIRERAYALWEEHGRPEGRENDHWEQARREIEEAKQTASSDEAQPAKGRARTKTAAAGETPAAKPARRTKAAGGEDPAAAPKRKRKS